MKRSANVLLGAVAGALLAGACLYGVALLWPRLSPPVAPAPTSAAATDTPLPPTDPPTSSEAQTPTVTGTPPPATDESPFLREIGPEATATGGTAEAPASTGGALPISRQLLQQPYEAEGFEFESVELEDGRARWVAASPDRLALVEIIGEEAVEAASVSVFGSLGPDSAAAGRRIIYLLTMLNAILPGWSEGAAWLGDEALRAAGQGGDYAASTTHNGVTIRFEVEADVESYTLYFEPN